MNVWYFSNRIGSENLKCFAMFRWKSQGSGHGPKKTTKKERGGGVCEMTDINN